MIEIYTGNIYECWLICVSRMIVRRCCPHILQVSNFSASIWGLRVCYTTRIDETEKLNLHQHGCDYTNNCGFYQEQRWTLPTEMEREPKTNRSEAATAGKWSSTNAFKRINMVGWPVSFMIIGDSCRQWLIIEIDSVLGRAARLFWALNEPAGQWQFVTW